MGHATEPRIQCVDKLPNAVFVAFEDGECAIYPAALLYETMPKVEPVARDEEVEADE
ncbi:MAG: hypothetical protein WBD91_08300 [Acidobacteriaceae bacterium]|jgi:hypothetical protein